MVKSTNEELYKVKSGDNLSTIAKQHGTTASALIALNKDRYPSLETKPDLIYPDWELKLTETAVATPHATAPIPQPRPEVTKQVAKTEPPTTAATMAKPPLPQPRPEFAKKTAKVVPETAKEPHALDEHQAREIQEALLDAGYKLPKYGADNDWGKESRAAAAQWQKDNGYEETGDLTVAQFAKLDEQASAITAEHQTKIIEATGELTQTLKDIDPVRKAMILQAAAHLGVKEHVIVPDKIENRGPAVDQYATSETGHVGQGPEWCWLFNSWVADQIEQFGGVRDFLPGEQNSQQMKALLKARAPGSLKTWNEYTPKPGDMILHTKDSSRGHGSIVAHVDKQNGIITTIDGNVQDSVRLVRWQINPKNQKQLRSLDANEDGSIGEYRRADFIDISRLPNFDRLASNFNAKSTTFVPTPSADPDFKGPDPEALKQLIELYKPANPAPDTFIAKQADPSRQPDIGLNL